MKPRIFIGELAFAIVLVPCFTWLGGIGLALAFFVGLVVNVIEERIRAASQSTGDSAAKENDNGN